MKRLTDWLAYLAVRIAVCLIQAIRLETCGRLSRLLAVLACDVLKIRSSVVDENIRHVFPQLGPAQRRVLARRMWEHLLLMICEIAHAPGKYTTRTGGTTSISSATARRRNTCWAGGPW